MSDASLNSFLNVITAGSLGTALLLTVFLALAAIAGVLRAVLE